LKTEWLLELYTNWIDRIHSIDKKKDKELFIGYSKQLRRMDKLFNGDKNIKILDYGSGWGYWAKFAKDSGYNNIYCSEIDKSREKHANEKFGINIFDANTDIKFDFINLEQVVEHIEFGVLDWLVKHHLSNKGIVRIAVPDGTNFFDNNTEEQLPFIQPLEHINCFNRLSLEFLSKRLKCEHIYFVPDSRSICYMSKQPINVLEEAKIKFTEETKQIQTIIHHRRKSRKERNVKILKIKKYEKYEKLGAYHWDLYTHDTRYREHVDFFVKQFDGIDKNSTIIDVGCGDGVLSSCLKKRGFNICGCDSDSTAIKLARTKDSEVTFACKSCYDIKSVYDYMVISEVLEHLSDPISALHTIYSHTKKFAIISTPNKSGSRWGKYDVNKWTARSLSYLFKRYRYHFEILKKERKTIYVKMYGFEYGLKKKRT